MVAFSAVTKKYSIGFATVLFALFVGSCLGQTSDINDDRPQVEIGQGKLIGVYSAAAEVALFSGIPYAGAPVGALRWKSPAPAIAWDGIRDASEFGSECLQTRSRDGGVFLRGMLSGMGLGEVATKAFLRSIVDAPLPKESEDCLFLNIRTGNLGREAKQPVMVWIHGGSHQNGAGSVRSYQSDTLVERGVVLVTLNYRLGAFGYLAHPALSAENEHGVSGNYGLLDQMVALGWVRDNIAAFGGDPNNITIFGESAGSQAVSELMASPLARGLFHKSIMESGVASRFILKLKAPNAMFPSTETAGVGFFAEAGLAAPEASVEALRAIPAVDIIAGVAAHPRYRSVFLPSMDGYVLPEVIGGIVIDHEMADVPILIGYNSDEGSLFHPFMKSPSIWLHNLPEEREARLQVIRDFYGEDAETLIELYGLGDEETRQQGEIDMLGDDYFGVHTRLMAKEHAARELPVFLYSFSRVPPSPKQTIGAYHSAEIPFVFDTHLARGALGEADLHLTEAMGDYWVNFARIGDPNGAGLPLWPQYDAEQDSWLQLDHEIKVVPGFRKAKLDALEGKVRRLVDASRER